jgi:uncharacterized protein YjbI with pentapeptide repeats
MHSDELLSQYAQGRRDFSGLRLEGLRIPRASLVGCSFANCEFQDCILAAADFRDCDLASATFNRCNAIEINLEGANLRSAKILEAAFGEADMFRACLADAEIRCNARGSFLVRADLSGTLFYGATLSGCHFGFNAIHATSFVLCDLADVHLTAPCDVDRTSVERSLRPMAQLIVDRERLPERDREQIVTAASHSLAECQLFFTNLGVDQGLVESESLGLLSAWLRQPSTFISYSSADEQFAAALHDQLVAAGIDTWFAPDDMRGGRMIHEQVVEEIRKRDRVILVLSESSLASNWVATELRETLASEATSHVRKLFPIRVVDIDVLKSWELFDADSGQDLARLVRQYHIPDFSGWRNALVLGEAVTRLARHLKPD